MRIMYTDRPPVEVPAALVNYTNGHFDLNEYQKSGREVYTQINLGILKHTGKLLTDSGSVLDFGCGAGRLLEHLYSGRSRVNISACDVSAPAIDFVRDSFPGVDAYCNAMPPPLKWESNTFDTIYAFSVFSHLTKNLEEQ